MPTAIGISKPKASTGARTMMNPPPPPKNPVDDHPTFTPGLPPGAGLRVCPFQSAFGETTITSCDIDGGQGGGGWNGGRTSGWA